MSSVSPRASIHETAQIGKDVIIGEFSVVSADAIIGSGSVIGHHVVIHEGSVIDEGVRIDDHAVIGKQPMKALTSATSSSEKQPPCHIGKGCIIGTHVTIYANCTVGPNCLMADYASVRENVEIGEKNILGRNVTVENWCTIGNRCKIETNAYITAYSTLENDIFVAPGVVTSNDNYVGRDPERFDHFKGVTLKTGARLGAQATVLPGKVIGEEALVAAGSVVTRDLEKNTVYMGVPARRLRAVPDKQLLKNQK